MSMKRTIHKFPLSTTEPTVVSVTGYQSRPIHAGLDPAGTPCVWVEQTMAADGPTLVVRIHGTGHPIDSDTATHLASFVQGQFVWHTFYEYLTATTP